MMRQWFGLLLWLVSQAAVSQQAPAPGDSPVPAEQPVPRLTAENINQQTQILRNPGLAVDNAQRVLSNAGQPPDAASSNNPPAGTAPVTLDKPAKRIADPTQMTGSFSQALSKIKPGAGAVQAAPAIPDISLVAKTIRKDNSRHALLRVAGKNRMVSVGSKFTFLENGALYELQVNAIEKDHVHITLLPTGREMLLE